MWKSRDPAITEPGKRKFLGWEEIFLSKGGACGQGEHNNHLRAAELSAGYMTLLTPARVSAFPYAIDGQHLGFGTLGTGLGSQDSANQEFVAELLCSI